MTTRVEDIRAKFWKVKDASEKFSSTVDRSLGLAQFEMQMEIAVQLVEMNAVLKNLNVVNYEKLALDLGRLLEQIERMLGEIDDKKKELKK